MTTLGALYGLSSAPSVQPSTASDAPGGVLGWLHNLASDAEQTVSGLGGIASQAVHDFGRSVAQGIDPLVPGHGVALGIVNDTDPTGYHLPQIAAALPGAVAHDYASRYGGASNIIHGLYQHPLSYILDALAVGSAVGKGAELVGSASLSAPEAVAAKTAAIAKQEELMSIGGLTEKVANPAGIRTGLDVLSEQRPLSGLEQLARNVLPEATGRRIGDVVLPFAEKNNPVERLAASPIKRLTQEPVGDLTARADELHAQMAPYIAAGKAPPATLQADYQQVQRVISGAQSFNMAKIQTPFTADKLQWLRGKGLLSKAQAADINSREGLLKQYVTALEPYYKEDPRIADIAKGVPDGLNVDYQAFVPDPALAGTRVTDATGTPIRVYHGTNQAFDQFDLSTAREGLYGKGFYFAENPQVAGGAPDVYGPAGYANATRGDRVVDVNIPVGEANTAQDAMRLARDRVGENLYPIGREHVINFGLEKGQVPRETWQVRVAVQQGTPNVHFAYLGMRNPFDTTAPLTGDQLQGIDAAVSRVAGNAPDAASLAEKFQGRTGRELYTYLSEAQGKDFANSVLQEAGYDGVFHVGQSDGRVWVAFHPDQISQGVKATPALNRAEWFSPERLGGPTTTVPFYPAQRLPPSPVLSAQERATAEQVNPALLAGADANAAKVDEFLGSLADGTSYNRGNLDVAQQTDAAQRYLDMQYGPVRRAISDPTGANTDITTRLTDTVRGLNAQRELDMLGKGDDMEHIMSRIYRAVQFKYGGVVDPVTGEMTGVPGWREFDDALRSAGVPQPTYYPYIPEEARHNFYEYLTNRVRIGGRRMAQDPNRKLFGGDLLRSGDYMTDPMEALTRRAVRYNRYEMLKNFYANVIQPSGRRISSIDELASNEGVVAPDGLFRFWHNSLGLQDMVDHLTSAGAKEDGLANALDSFLFKGREEFLQSGITRQGMELYAVPQTLIRQMESYSRASGLFGNPLVRMFWDTPTNLWRSLVLQYSPRWIVNNSLGNTVMQAIGGYGRIRDVLTIAEEKFRQAVYDKLGWDFHSNVLDMLDQVPGIEGARTGGFTGVENLYNAKRGSVAEANPGVENVFRKLAGGVPTAAKKVGDFNLRLNGAIEDTAREATYIDALQKADLIKGTRPVAKLFWSTKRNLEDILSRSSEISDGQITSAYKDLANTLGNYGALGPVERNVIRRFIFPFWGFYKHQAGMLARLPIDSPIRAVIVRGLGNVNQEMLQQYGAIPSWLEGAVPFGPPGSQVPFFSSRGPNPFNASFQSIPSMLNPFAQLAISRSLGRNLYTGQSYSGSPYDYYTPFGSEQSYRYIRDSNGNLTQMPVPVQGHIEPNLIDQILQTVPQYQSIKSLIAGGQPYDTTSLVGAIKGRLSGTETRFADTTKPTSPLNELLRLSGLGTTTYDLGSYQQKLLQGQLQALGAAQTG